MKRAFCFSCLLLSLCILFPVFLISASALIEVDNNKVSLAWWYDNPVDYVSFENQVISRVGYDSLTIQVDIELNEIVKAKSVFSFELRLDFGDVGSILVTKFQPLDENSVALDNLSVSVVNNKISVSDLQYKEDVKYIRIQFSISRPTWIVEADESYMTISGETYTFQKGTTWGDWVDSEYNTIGLFIENDGIYGSDVKLTRNGELVKPSDAIVEQASYSLDPLQTEPTTIEFYVYCYGLSDAGQTKSYYADPGMTWVDWVASDYNTDGFSTWAVSNTIRDANGRFIYSAKLPNYDAADPNSAVYTNDLIIKNHTYYAVGTSSTYTLRGYNIYTFDFSVTSVSTIVDDEQGVLNGIISWVKDIANTVKDMPSKIGQVIGAKLNELGEWLVDKIKGLFVPTQEELEDIIEKFEALLQDRFGIAYDANKIIDDFAAAFTYSEGMSKISFPSVTVNLAGTYFTFGGWEVDLIPRGFEGLAESLKFIVNIVCTFVYIMAIRKRWEEVIR